jgi:hypothetical protein
MQTRLPPSTPEATSRANISTTHTNCGCLKVNETYRNLNREVENDSHGVRNRAIRKPAKRLFSKHLLRCIVYEANVGPRNSEAVVHPCETK